MTVPTSITEPLMGHTEQESHLKSKEEEHSIPIHLIQHVFQTVMGLCIDGQLEKLSHWIQFREYGTLDDMYEEFCNNPEDINKYEDFKWNGVKDHIGPSIALKIKGFTKWMNVEKDISVLYDHFLLSLTKEDYMEFRKMDIELTPNTTSYHGEPTKPMTTFYGHTKSTTISESQTALNNFKRGTKRDASAYPILCKYPKRM